MLPKKLPSASTTISNSQINSEPLKDSLEVNSILTSTYDNSVEDFHGLESAPRRSSHVKIPKVIPSLITQCNDAQFTDPDNLLIQTNNL